MRCGALFALRPDLAAAEASGLFPASSPVAMRVPPTPIGALLRRLKQLILPVTLLATLFHQPMAVGTVLGFVPFVPVTVVAIVISVMFLSHSLGRQGRIPC